MFGFDVFLMSHLMSRRTGTLLSDKKIEMRTFVLIAYFFVTCFLTHLQLIHEVSLTLADGYFKTSKEKKTCCHTSVVPQDIQVSFLYFLGCLFLMIFCVMMFI